MRTTPTLPSTPLHILTTHTAPINTLLFSHNGGTYILSGSSDRQIHLSRTEPASKSASSQPPTNTLTSQSQNRSPLSVPTTKDPIQRYTSHGYAVLSLSLTTDNTRFASSSADRSGPFLWDVNTADATLRRFGGTSPSPHTSRITCVSFAASDNIVVSGSDDRSVRLWDVKSRDSRPLMVLEEAKDGITSLVCRDSEIISGSSDGRVRSYDVRMGRCVVDVAAGVVTSVDVSRDGRVMLVGCLDGRLRVMDREGGGCLRVVPGELDVKGGDVNVDEGSRDGKMGYVNSSLRLQSCFGVDEKVVMSGSEADGRVRAWDVLTGKMIGCVDVSERGKVVSVVKWRDGSEILGQERRGVWAAGGVDGVVRIYG